jgi:hypothetical protein
VSSQLRKILRGKSAQIAAGIRRRATAYGYVGAERADAGECARYLSNKARYLGYSTALARGWPSPPASSRAPAGKDRMDTTGARWSLDGAEVVLKLRAITANGDFDGYWRFHLRREHERIHHAKYQDSQILAA